MADILRTLARKIDLATTKRQVIAAGRAIAEDCDRRLQGLVEIIDREIACARQAGDQRVADVLTKLREKIAEVGA